ncbi:MAG: GNAT family N-acetyltransferase, partial [Eubacteriales bacterium]|nr:GNAT family N-acetyltransferase [Eubacteriales bacterium]
MKQQNKPYLIRDELANIDVLEAALMPNVQKLAENEHGVLYEFDNLYFLACDQDHAESFFPLITEGLTAASERLVVLRGAKARNQLEQFGFRTQMECYNAVYPSREPIPYSLPEGAEIRKLDERYVDFVHAHYHMVEDVRYIRERIEADMFGVFLNGEIAGFVGTHEERSMGLLEILPEYRRLGLAYALEAHLINHLLSQGRIPVCQVAIVN